MRLGYLLGHAAMMIALLAHDEDIEALAREALHNAVQLCDERADEIVEQIDTSCGKAFLGVVIKTMKSEHEPIAWAQGRDIVRQETLLRPG
jgi:hypothetical protein